MFKTQKAIGLQVAQSLNGMLGMRGPGVYNGMLTKLNPGIYTVYPHTQSIPAFPFFARPCPMFPRHGFVESRSVVSPLEMMRVVQETYAADKDGEIIFMPRLSAAFSMVITMNSVTIGNGNDGATASKAGSVTLHAPGVDINQWNSRLDHYHGLTRNEGEALYVEAVEDEGRIRIVQLRSGPILPLATEFIPKKSIIAAIFIGPVASDLLEWETQVDTMLPGTVVWWPEGSLSSHYAVHCIQHGIPFLTRPTCPTVGDELTPSGLPKVTARGRKKLARELEKAIKNCFRSKNSDQIAAECRFALAIAHAHSIWGDGKVEAKLRARALISLIRLNAVACIGEARHFYRCGPGRTTDFEHPGVAGGWTKPVGAEYKRDGHIVWKDLIPLDDMETKYGIINPPRPTVYNHMVVGQMDKLMAINVQAEMDLADPGWQQGMGGEKWMRSASLANRTWLKVKEFIVFPTVDNYRSMVVLWNRLTNAVHNGGPILNKWIDAGQMDTCAKYPSLAVGASAKIILDVVDGLSLMTDDTYGKPLEEDEYPQPLQVEEHDVGEDEGNEPFFEEPVPPKSTLKEGDNYPLVFGEDISSDEFAAQKSSFLKNLLLNAKSEKGDVS